jgi:hypothetical protein
MEIRTSVLFAVNTFTFVVVNVALPMQMLCMTFLANNDFLYFYVICVLTVFTNSCSHTYVLCPSSAADIYICVCVCVSILNYPIYYKRIFFLYLWIRASSFN